MLNSLQFLFEMKDVEWNHDTQTGLWLNEGHWQRMEALADRQQRPTPACLAAMYLLTANRNLSRHTAGCFRREGIAFKYATTKNISPHGYTLLSAAKDIYADGRGISINDLADTEVIDPTAFRLIVNALHIVRSADPEAQDG